MLEQVAQRGYGISTFRYFPSEILKHHLIEADNEYLSSLDQKTSKGPLHPKLSYDRNWYSILENSYNQNLITDRVPCASPEIPQIIWLGIAVKELTGYFVKQYFIMNCIITVSLIVD